MGLTLDITNTHLQRQHGDITAVYTWIDDERALVLLPTYRKGAPWYCVLESASYKYDDTEYLARQGKKACEVLGLEPSLPNWVRVAGIINEGLPDLIRMPSAPERLLKKHGFGDLHLMVNGEKVHSETMYDEVQSGVSYG